jgi:molybdopterin converting factor subunit 1
VIRVLFFARLREQVGEAELELTPGEAGNTVGQLVEVLRSRGDRWHAALGAGNLLCAVNQKQAERAQPIADGDEVALYPPVTGG